MNAAARRPDRRRCCVGLVACVLAAYATGLAGETESVGADPDLDEKALAALIEGAVPSPWSAAGDLRAGTGYRSNVQLSSVNPVAAAFLSGGGDFMLNRIPLDGTGVSILASADYTHFLGAPQVDPESLALARAELKRDLGAGWTAGLAGQYVFMNQVFDVSATEAELSTATAKGSTLTLTPSAAVSLGRNWKLESVLDGSRQLFSAPLDNYWELGPNVKLAKALAAGRDCSLSYRFTRRWYEDRAPLDADGSELPGDLEFDLHELEVRTKIAWDARRRWYSQLRLGLRWTEDNGGGYFDNLRPVLGVRAGYGVERWKVWAEFRGYWYDYPIQRSDGPDSALRRKTDLDVTVRGEYRLWKRLTAFAQYDRESAFDNAPSADYDAHTVAAGVELEL